jgi:NADH-quinone oxidoreductase subunit C
MDAAKIHEVLVGRFGAKVTTAALDGPTPFVVVEPGALVEILTFLKEDGELAFDNLMNLSAVDWPKETPPRMEVVYHLLSYRHGHTFGVKVHLPREEPQVDTVEALWPVANWHEREAYDLFGITFRGHSDPRRILLPDDWTGHPLRKDWVDPELYNGLRVKPTAQMAERALGGEKLGVGPFEFTPANSHVEGQ